MYVPFSATGRGLFSEGLVVRFQGSAEDSWVGNFARGLTGFSKVLRHPDGTRVLVISGGQAYDVNPDVRATVDAFGGWFVEAFELPNLRLVVLQTSIDFMAIGPCGRAWETRRMSIDGFRSVVVHEDRLQGEAWALGERWVPFEIDLNSGRVTGGIRL
jgi:hypothetical protein